MRWTGRLGQRPDPKKPTALRGVSWGQEPRKRRSHQAAHLAEIPEQDLRERLEKGRRKRLEELVAEAREGSGDVPCQILIAWGRPFQEILRRSVEYAVNLIVLGTAGRSADLERALFGSTAEKVLRAASCPVLCVPSDF